MHRSFLVLPLLALGHPAFAQEADNTLVVTGEALDAPEGEEALATEEIDREGILAAPSGRIEDVLEGVAGFQQFRRSDSRSANPSAQGATLRALGGNATSRALVLLDGVPLADPFFGYIPFFAIAAERLGRIAVTRGGGAGAFGAGSKARGPTNSIRSPRKPWSTIAAGPRPGCRPRRVSARALRRCRPAGIVATGSSPRRGTSARAPPYPPPTMPVR